MKSRNRQLWPQIWILIIAISSIGSYYVINATWHLGTDWSIFSQSSQSLKLIIKDLLVNQRFNYYFALLNQHQLYDDFLLHIVIPISFVTISTSLIVVKILYVKGGRSTNIHIAGQSLLKSSKAIRNSKKNLKRELASDSMGVGVHLHPNIRITRRRELGNIFAFGQSGSGKGVFIKPIVKEIIERGDLIFIFDEKREYTPIFHSEKSTLISPSDMRSKAWNPSKDINNAEQAFFIAERLIPNSNEDEFWLNGARIILAGCFITCNALYKRWGWAHVKLILDSSEKELVDYFSKYYRPASKLIKKESKTTEGFISVIVIKLQWIDSLARAWPKYDENDFSISDWVEGKTEENVLIIPSDPLLSSIVAPLVHTMFSIAVRCLLALPDSNTRTVWFCLDELGSLPQCISLVELLSKGRSKGSKVIAGVQNSTQLTSIYGKDQAETLLSLFSNIACFRLGVGGDSAYKASQALGTNIVEKQSHSLDKNHNRTISFIENSEPVVRVDQITQLPQANDFGVEGFLTVSGWNSVYHLHWPLCKIPDVADVFIPAAWLSHAKEPNLVSSRGSRGNRKSC